MQKKIFRVMTLLVSCTLLIFLIFTGSISYTNYREDVGKRIRSAAESIVQADRTFEEITELTRGITDFDIRITFIDAQGKAVYDSEADVTQMEDHNDRPEVRQALKNGSGEDTRTSETLGYSTYYYAVSYNGGVLRFAADRSNLAGVFLTAFPLLVVLAGVIILVTTVISIKLSEGLIRPINDLVKQLDLRNDNIGELETPYEELEPIIKNADVLMTRIRRSVAKVKREKEKISLITENMVEGMILLDCDMIILSVNKSALKILGSDYDRSEKKPIGSLTDNEDLLELFYAARENGSSARTLLINDRFYNIFVNRAESESGGYGFGYIAFLMDVTESVKAEQIRRDFSANVSHELKTPLTTIKGFGELLDNGIFNRQEDVKKYGSMIYRESERLLALINDIIKLSEIEEGDSLLNDDIDLLKTAEDAAEILRYKADRSSVSIDISGESVWIKGNASYISEVLLNLMDNAVKYNNEGGSVWITVGSSGNFARVSVKDNGIGISEENCRRIFERFYRVDKSRSKRTGGTGLGLSIVKHIVACHNGEITVKSRQGEGTEITVILPLPGK